MHVRYALCFSASLVLMYSTAALAEMDDMCAPPAAMKTDKWQSRAGPVGMNFLTPSGYGAYGTANDPQAVDSHFFRQGEHHFIAAGSGRGPTYIMDNREVTEKSECETVISGRRVNITVYNWVVEDGPLSASGTAGAHFAAIARFYGSGSQHESYLMLQSNVPSDVKTNKQIFWTATFGGQPAMQPGQQLAAASATPSLGEPSATVAASAPAAGPSAPATAVAAQKVCAPVVQPGLPTSDAVIDSTTVQSLLAGATPIPAGFEVMKLQFDGSGELAGLTVAQSDLPEASQRELAAVIGTNLKPHDSHAPPALLLRIDSAASGLRYSVMSAAGCE